MRKYERPISVPVGEEQNTPHHSVTAWTVQMAEIGGAKPTWCANLPANMLQSDMSNAQLFACTLRPLQSRARGTEEIVPFFSIFLNPKNT